MRQIAQNVLAVLGGIVGGSLVNIGLVNIGPMVVPLPEGADVSTMENLEASMKLFTPINFLFPFLGHALGTLAGAFLAALLAFSHPMKLAMGIGVFFLVGGIAAINMLGGPLWFSATDLLLAYLPMGIRWRPTCRREQASRSVAGRTMAWVPSAISLFLSLRVQPTIDLPP